MSAVTQICGYPARATVQLEVERGRFVTADLPLTRDAGSVKIGVDLDPAYDALRRYHARNPERFAPATRQRKLKIPCVGGPLDGLWVAHDPADPQLKVPVSPGAQFVSEEPRPPLTFSTATYDLVMRREGAYELLWTRTDSEIPPERPRREPAKVEAKIDLDTSDAQRSLDKLRLQLERLNFQRDYVPGEKLEELERRVSERERRGLERARDAARAESRLGRLEIRLDGLAESLRRLGAVVR